MVKVAVAGGSGGIGRHIVEGILATKKHTVVALSRSPSNATLEALGAQVAAVDYTDHASLVNALQGVHTVISAIWADGDELSRCQISLLNAAVEIGVKRFAPSEWSVASKPNDPIHTYKIKATVTEALNKSGIEWTAFETGVFMNYFVTGTKGIGYLQPLKFVIDVENGTARVPGTGDQKVSYTRGEDVGAFVAASLDLPKWPKRLGMAGEAISFNEVVSLAEKVRGRKFEVTYVPEDELRKRTAPGAPESFAIIYTQILLEILRSRFVYETDLNDLFPEVKPMKVEELLKKWWV